MLTLHGIKSCDSCRKARQYLTSKNIEHHFHDVREDGLDIQMIERWGAAVDWQQLLNKKSLTRRKVPEVDRASLTQDKAFALLLDNPTLVKRPVLENGKQITIGFSESSYDDVIANIQN